MGYMIEGGGSKTMEKSKAWLNDHPDATKKLLDLLTNVIVEYLEMQVEAGAQLLQVFESSAEHLSREQFLTIAMPQLKAIRVKLLARLAENNIPAVPMVRAYMRYNIHPLTYILYHLQRRCLQRAEVTRWPNRLHWATKLLVWTGRWTPRQPARLSDLM